MIEALYCAEGGRAPRVRPGFLPPAKAKFPDMVGGDFIAGRLRRLKQMAHVMGPLTERALTEHAKVRLEDRMLLDAVSGKMVAVGKKIHRDVGSGAHWREEWKGVQEVKNHPLALPAVPNSPENSVVAQDPREGTDYSLLRREAEQAGSGMPWTQNGIPLGHGDDVHPAQSGFPEALSGFAEIQSGFRETLPGFRETLPGFWEAPAGGSQVAFNPMVHDDMDVLISDGFDDGGFGTVSGMFGSWSAPVNPAAPYAGGYPHGAAWEVQPAVTDTLTQAARAAQELSAAAPVYPRTGDGVAYSPWEPTTAHGRAGHAQARQPGHQSPR
ncbi:hypothetical protein ACJ6WF_17950 [Streptomyces sp. MMS24-I2-30]|uniref:hypothetical protein n=1 Tax=Streptomyces sp. MMS24-I2-30 TaxID=3351564 RepID=UPI0038969550